MSPRICWLCKLQQNGSSGVTSKLSGQEVIQWSQSFQSLMTSKYGPIVYKAYLKTEYSDENLEFWIACEKYKRIKCRWKRAARARKLFKLYIRPNAPREINIDSPTREDIIQELQDSSPYCFEDAQKIVYHHMERDSYPRFLQSSIYQGFISRYNHQT
ncbi:regulator of G-protein signaling 13 [Ambystoma mexicanum]|uniref:regulator of G-protein signaling 13 n=1 Tax=Ambystoma mexicanum TaxID=8296 RepID=UPI0037E94F15